MKSFKKVISIIAALALLITTLAVTASVSVSAEDAVADAPVYFTKFTADNFVGFGEYSPGEEGYEEVDGDKTQTRVQEGDISYPLDGAVDLATKSTSSRGVRAIFKLDDTAKQYFKQLEDEAAAKYEENVKKAKEKAERQGKEFKIESVAKVYPSVKSTFFVKQSTTSKGLDIDLMIGYAFILKDGTVCESPIGYGMARQTKTVNVSICKKVLKDGETKYEAIDLDQIEYVRLEVYHWNSSLKEVIFAGFTVSGEGELPEREAIDVGNDKTAVAFNFDKEYRRDYAPSPKEILYCDVENPTDDDGNPIEDGKRGGFNKKGNPGWSKWQCVGNSQQYQSAYWFDRDQFDYALAVANRKDENGNLIGSGKFLFTFSLESCVDAEGKPVKAELKVHFSTHSKGYVLVIDEWQDAGTTVQYEIDATQFERSDVGMIIFCVQNYFYYDKNGELVEYPESGKEVEVKLEDGDISKTVKYGTGVKWVGGIVPQVKMSPITVKEPNQILTTAAPLTTTVPTTTKAPTQEIEGAGYHFYDFVETGRILEYGNQPLEPIQYFNSSKDVGENVILVDEDDDFNGGFKMKSRYSNVVSKQYQQHWTTMDSKAMQKLGYEIETVLTEAQRRLVYNRMKQALAYANAPGAPGMLAFKAKVNSAKNGTFRLVGGKEKLISGSGEDCTVQIGMQIACYDYYDSIFSYKYQGKGGVQTHYMDVSELSVDQITIIHPMAQNYANVDKETGNACGMYDVDVDFSAIYVVGNGAGAPTKTQAATADNAEVEALYSLFKQLPGLELSDYKTEADWALLEKFIEACSLASVQTMNGLEAKGVTSDTIGKLQDLYLWGGGELDDGPDTGATAAPIAALCLAAAAGFVFMKFRKK